MQSRNCIFIWFLFCGHTTLTFDTTFEALRSKYFWKAPVQHIGVFCCVWRQQELSNLLHEKKYLKALGLAISLDQPRTVLTVIKGALCCSRAVRVTPFSWKMERCFKPFRLPGRFHSDIYWWFACTSCTHGFMCIVHRCFVFVQCHDGDECCKTKNGRCCFANLKLNSHHVKNMSFRPCFFCDYI